MEFAGRVFSSASRFSSGHVAFLGIAVGVLAAGLFRLGFESFLKTALLFGGQFAILLIVMSVHEWGHAYVANRLGDGTARSMKRMTLNPFAHIDRLGTIIVPLVLIFSGAQFLVGWAKPVPVVAENLCNPLCGMVLVALAGPGANFVAGLAFTLVFVLLSPAFEALGGMGMASIAVFLMVVIIANFAIGIFNLMPLYPMDGGRVVAAFLPAPARDWLAANEFKVAMVSLGLVGTFFVADVGGVGSGLFELFFDAIDVYGDLLVVLRGATGV